MIPDQLLSTGNLPEQWARFKKQFKQFLDASENSEASDRAKIAMLLRTIGDKDNDIFDNFSFEADAQPTFVDVLDKFETFCKPHVSLFTARHQFLTIKQNTRYIDEFFYCIKEEG